MHLAGTVFPIACYGIPEAHVFGTSDFKCGMIQLERIKARAHDRDIGTSIDRRNLIIRQIPFRQIREIEDCSLLGVASLSAAQAQNMPSK